MSDASDCLYPISFYQERVLKSRAKNYYAKAYEKAMTYELYSLNYAQPKHFSKQILGRRLEEVILRIRLKLAKIKKAMRIA